MRSNEFDINAFFKNPNADTTPRVIFSDKAHARRSDPATSHQAAARVDTNALEKMRV
jgi:hypothetical protein